MEEREPLCTIGGNINWFSLYGKQYGVYLKILKVELQNNLTIPLLGVYPKKMKTELTEIPTSSTLIIALFITAKIQMKRLSTDEWTKKM